MDSAIQKTVKKMDVVTSDRGFQHQYLLREMALSDKTTEINTAIEKQDIKTKVEIAQNLLHEGSTIKFIQRITGLDIATIKRIKG
jgi:uncharacterized protein YerC